MNPERYAVVRTIFHKALQLEPEHRESFLRDSCAGDPSLLLEVEALLKQDRAMGGPLDTPTGERFASSGFEMDERGGFTGLPTQVDEFTVVRAIGEGGMGIVCEARQKRLNRSVALKLLHPRLFSRDMLRRFEREAEVLGKLQHPGIAQVIRSGVTEFNERSCPYFAMEYIDGRPITTHVARNNLSISDRLQLVIQVCQAAQHAHQRGVIHRDLKPANILVTENGRAKILDFGIARITGAEDAQRITRTDLTQLIGTLQYMSPEQAGGNHDIDARSDVYALGAVAFEVLTGQPPMDIGDLPLPEAIRAVAEGPRKRLAQAEPPMKGDLDIIVGKALALYRDQRYDSAAAFADDLRRYLQREPISARPLSASYQLWTFSRRNPVLTALAGALTLVLMLGIGISTLLAIRATRAERLADERLGIVRRERDRAIEAEEAAEQRRREAERQRNIADAVNTFLNDDLLASANPERDGRNVTVKELLDIAATRMGTRFKDNPSVEAAVSMTIGLALQSLGEVAEAGRSLEKAAHLYEQESGPYAAETLQARRALALNHIDEGRLEEAERLLSTTVQATIENFGERHVEAGRAQRDWGLLLLALGRYDEADESMSAGLATLEVHAGIDHSDTLDTRYHLARIKVMRGAYGEALALLLELLDDQRRVLGPAHPDTLTSTVELAGLHLRREENDEALSLLQQVVDVQREVFGPEHPETIHAQNNLAAAHKLAGQFEAAEPLYLALIPVCDQPKLEGLRVCTSVLNNLARLYDAQQRFEEAEPFYQRALERRTRLLGADHPDTCGVKENLAAMYARTDRLDEAIDMTRHVLASRQRQLGESHRETIFSTYYLGSLLARTGKDDRIQEAAGHLGEAVHQARETLGSHSPWVGKYLLGHARALSALQRLEEAEPLLLEAYDILENALGIDHELSRQCADALADLYRQRKDPRESQHWQALAGE